MILPTSEIAARSAQEKAKLIVEGGARMKASRYQTAIALALLARSNGFLEFGCKVSVRLSAPVLRAQLGRCCAHGSDTPSRRAESSSFPAHSRRAAPDPC